MWNVTQCDTCRRFVARGQQCMNCHPPPPPPVKVRDPKDWKDSWQAERNAEALLLEDMATYGVVVEVVDELQEEVQN